MLEDIAAGDGHIDPGGFELLDVGVADPAVDFDEAIGVAFLDQILEPAR